MKYNKETFSTDALNQFKKYYNKNFRAEAFLIIKKDKEYQTDLFIKFCEDYKDSILSEISTLKGIYYKLSRLDQKAVLHALNLKNKADISRLLSLSPQNLGQSYGYIFKDVDPIPFATSEDNDENGKLYYNFDEIKANYIRGRQ